MRTYTTIRPSVNIKNKSASISILSNVINESMRHYGLINNQTKNKELEKTKFLKVDGKEIY